MNNHLENKLTMLHTVDKTFDSHVVQVESIPKLAEGHAQLKIITDGIMAERKVQDRDDTGVAKDKKVALAELVLVTLKVSGGIVSFATENNDHTLASRAYLVASDINGARDTVIPDICKAVLQLTEGIESEIAPFGVSSLMLWQLDLAIAKYSSLMVAPRTATTQRSTAGSQMLDLFARADKLLVTLDLLMNQFADTDTTFFREYTKARIIIDLGGHSRPDEPTGSDGVPPVA